MAITNLYPNLPGHLVEFKDGGLQLTTGSSAKAGKSLLILGTAFDGPVNEPVKVDETTVSQLFGPDVDVNGFPNGATLTKYIKQAFKNGFTDVRGMRVTGSQAYVEIPKVISTITEQIKNTVLVDIVGNSEQKFIQLSNVPVVSHSLDVTTGPNGTGTRISPSSMSRYDGQFDIAKDLVPAGSTIYATYQYQVISAERTITSADVSADGVVVGNSIPLCVDAQGNAVADEFIYVTDKVAGQYVNNGVGPETDGPIVTVDGTGAILAEGVDYTVVNGVLTFLPNANVQLTDTVTVKYYTYTVQAAQETITFNDPDQVVTLPQTPLANTISVVMNGVTVTADTVISGNTVTFPAGSFPIGSAAIEYIYELVTEHKESMTVRAIYGGSAYKTANIAITEVVQDGVTGKRFTFTKPEAKRFSNADLPFYFDSFTCKTVGMLKMALADYALNNVFEIICDDDDMITADFPLFASDLVNGGDDGVVVTNNELYEALSGKRYTQEDVAAQECTPEMVGYLKEQGAYQILENYNVDFIYPAGVYADSKQTVNKYSSFHHELALLCAVLTYRTKMTHGFIDVKPNSNTTLKGVQDYVSKLIKYDNVHYMMDAEGNDIVDSEGNKMDIGWYTSLVVGPEPVMVSDTLGTYYGSPAIAYAALCGSLKPQSAPTNKAIPGVKGMKYKFSNKQMNELVGNRMVVFKLKNEGVTSTASSTPFVVDGCTAGAPNSDYGRISTVKVVTDVVDQIREVADPFLGEPNTVEQRNALSALISKRLSYLMEQGEITYYQFEINATIQQVILGECSISLTLAAPQELRKITTVVALRASA